MDTIHLPTKWIRLTLPGLSETEARAVMALASLGPGLRSFPHALAWVRKQTGRCPRKRINRLIAQGVVTVTLSINLRVGIQVNLGKVAKRPHTKEWVKHVHGESLSKYLAIPAGQLAYLASLPDRAGVLWLFLKTSPHPTSIRTLARRLGWGREAVRQAIRVLEENGLLVWNWQPEEMFTTPTLKTPPEIAVPEVPVVESGRYVRAIPKGLGERLRLARRIAQTLKDMESVVQLTPPWLQVFGYKSPQATDRFWNKSFKKIPLMVALGELRPPRVRPLAVDEFVIRCDHAPSVRTPGVVLYTSYLTLCVAMRRPPLTRREFGVALKQLGYEKRRLGWAGIAPPASGIGIRVTEAAVAVSQTPPPGFPPELWADAMAWLQSEGQAEWDDSESAEWDDPEDEAGDWGVWEWGESGDEWVDPEELAALNALDSEEEEGEGEEGEGEEGDAPQEDAPPDPTPSSPASAPPNDDLAALIKELRSRIRPPGSSPGPPMGIDW